MENGEAGQELGEQRPEYITITDDAGRSRRQKVEYVVEDVKGETIYVTVEGLQYAHDSLAANDRVT